MAKRKKILVPEARSGLDLLKAKLSKSESPESSKYEVAKEVGVPLKHGYNGELTSHQAGKVGGEIGGRMVKELVKMAQESIAKNR